MKKFKLIKFDIDGAITRLKIRHAKRIQKSFVHMREGAREEIRDLIRKSGVEIEMIDVPLSRKKALMTKLNAFADEVDRNRVSLESFAALVIEAADSMSDVDRKLRPIRGWIDSMAVLLHDACALNEQSELSALISEK